jgi:feruloyl esterase
MTHRRVLRAGLFAALIAAPVNVISVAGEQQPPGDNICERLATVTLPQATVTLAQLVDAGAPITAGAARGGEADAAVRAPRPFCRIAATLTPSADSDIKIELWMPAAGWNEKFQAVGNGAFSGSIAYPAMANALRRGYAVASTDTGHTGNTARFALGHPEKVVDFGWRAVHEMTVASKQIVGKFYERGPRYSYWTGCSAGGRQAMKEAQRFPEDFQGIVAGAPGLDWTGRAAQATRVAKALESRAAARLLEPQRKRLHDAALAACDAADGLKDGLIADPQRCTFDPAVTRCAGSESDGCLSDAQVETARLIYSSAVNGRSGRQAAGLMAGSELGWSDLGWTASARATGLDQFRFIVFGDQSWTIDRFDTDTDLARADDVDGGTINALDPNLKPFFDRGGKLIHYHGWSDPQISPGNSTQYYSRVTETLGGASNVHSSYRLFMAPGMGHCGGGEGPNTFDMLTALERWVEQGQAPDSILATHSTNGAVDRTRPLCPFPQIAVYKGSGNTSDAAQFECRAP